MDTIFKKFIYKYMDNDLSNIFCSCSVKLLCLWAVFYSASIICFHIVMQLWCAQYASFDIACDKNNQNKKIREWKNIMKIFLACTFFWEFWPPLSAGNSAVVPSSERERHLEFRIWSNRRFTSQLILIYFWPFLFQVVWTLFVWSHSCFLLVFCKMQSFWAQLGSQIFENIRLWSCSISVRIMCLFQLVTIILSHHQSMPITFFKAGVL